MDPSDPPDGAASVAIEVYPHPAMVSLFDLATVIPYKDKPGRTTTSRKAAFGVLLDAIERVCEEPLRLATSTRWAEIRAAVASAQRPIDLRVVEDEIDAILCAYLAWLWGRRDPQMRVLGDVERGYIVVPGPPRVVPARAAAVRTGRGAQADPMHVAGLAEAFRTALPSLSSDDAARLAQVAAARGAR
jgi:predicted RNase H-like nuclease